ncbi:hypothetical protein Tco_0394364 [Tanacetum coccineum]
MTDSSWIEAIQEEIHEFDRLQVWELVPRPLNAKLISLKWIFKIPLYSDSKSAIALRCNSVKHSGTKGIVVQYHFIKEQVENDTVELYFVNMAYQLVDIFTKELGRERFEFLINRLGLESITPERLKRLAESDEG